MKTMLLAMKRGQRLKRKRRKLKKIQMIVPTKKTQQSTSSKERKQRSTPQRQTRKNSVTNSAPANKKKRKKEEKANDPDDLVAAIRGNAVARRGREESFGNFMSSLEERYAPSKARKKNKRKNNKINPEPDIPDDEFAKIQARLLKKRK
mmetsp:Transcript_171/g.242  ORF Transcript_171/g.242 Transcript_171/m.242 type:complete len:149 (+) Transcript_171:35-481(+)